MDAVGSLVNKKVNDLTKTLKLDLAEFGDTVSKETSNKVENVKKEMQDAFKECGSKIQEAMKKEINAMEERIITRMETKITSMVEDAVSKGSFSFVPFDSSLLTDLDGPAAKKQCTGVSEEPNDDLEIRPVTPTLPKETIKSKSSTTKKYSWKKDNPEGEEFIAEKCAAVQYRRAQHVKESIYCKGIKEGLWNESDEMFLKVSMKIDSICKSAH